MLTNFQMQSPMDIQDAIEHLSKQKSSSEYVQGLINLELYRLRAQQEHLMRMEARKESINTEGARTGRFTSNNPNKCQWASKGTFKQMFEGAVDIGIDYNAQEKQIREAMAVPVPTGHLVPSIKPPVIHDPSQVWENRLGKDTRLC